MERQQLGRHAAGRARAPQHAGCGEVPVHSVLCFLGTELPQDIMNVNGVVVCKGEKLIEVTQETFDKPISLGLREQVVRELLKVIE